MKYAFDKNNNIIYAKDLDFSSSGIKFKCANPDCNGDVLLRNSNSNYKSSCFYFRSNIRDKFGELLNDHISNCYALTSSNSSKYDIKDFDFNSFINNLTTKTPNNSSKIQASPNPLKKQKDKNQDYMPKIKTLKQLYNFCSTALPYEKLGNTIVKNLFVGENTVKYYKLKQKEVSSPMLFHLKRVYKSEDFDKLEFQAICKSESSKLFLQFKIKFENNTLFKKTLNSFFYNKSNVKLSKAKFDLLVLSTPGQLIPTENSDFYVQELLVNNSSNIHIL